MVPAAQRERKSDRLAGEVLWRGSRLAKGSSDTDAKGPKDSWTGRTTRVLSMLMDTYDELRAAAEFIYRADPAMLAHFGSMYSTIRARPQRSEKPKDA